MATSTIPALKTGLVAMLQARPGLNGVRVSYGPPIAGLSREFIWVSSAQGQRTRAAQGGLMEEEYQQRVVLLVLHQGEDMQAADDRCFAFLAELEQGLHDDPKVGGVVNDAYIGGFTLDEGADDQSRESTLTVQIDCKAWI